MKIRLLHLSIIPIMMFVLVCMGFSSHTTKVQDIQTTVTNPSIATIYNGSLASNWYNWSWNSTVQMQTATPSYGGSNVISFSPNAWGALYLHADIPIDISQFQEMHFVMQASQPNEKFSLIFFDQDNHMISPALPLSEFGGYPTVGYWKQYSISLSSIHPVNNMIKGFAIQDNSGTVQAPAYVGNIAFINASVHANDSVIYTDALAQGWSNWSWNSTVDFTNTATVYQGQKAIAFTPTSAWGGLYLHTDSVVDTSAYQFIHFAGKSSQPGEKFAIQLFDANNQPISSPVSLDTYSPLTATSWQVFTIPLHDVHADATDIKGIGIFDLSGHPQPVIYIDDIRFTNDATVLSSPISQVSLSPTPESTSPATISVTSTQQTVSVGGSGYTVSNGDIFRNGGKITLHGISWFGFETGNHALQGLWAVNWKDSLTQMKSLGFNAVRIPFCPATVQNTSVNGIDYSKNPDLQGLTSLSLLDKVVNEINNQQMYILLDHHTPDCNTISDLWYTGNYSEQQWLTDLHMVVDRYKNLPYFMGIDIKNEPHGSATWGTGNTATDWNTAAEKAGRTVLAADPNILVFVQGIQNNPSCSNNSIGHWQGGNLEPVNCKPISSDDIPTNKLVFSPHVYGPDVWMQSYFNDSTFPNNMPSIWDAQFGYLTSKGQTIVPGEWGGRMGTNNGNPKDGTLQTALVNYFISKHICNSFYWDWNPNSGDTGGILQDDWKTAWLQKMQILNSYFTKCQ